MRQDPAYHFSNWHHLPSPYGPLLTLLTEALAPLGLPTAYWTWKAIVLAAALGTLVLVALAARRLGRSPQAAVALVGLNPLVLVYGIGGAHNEPLMLLLGVAAVALAIVGWEARVAWWDVAAGACAVARGRLQAVGRPARACRRARLAAGACPLWGVRAAPARWSLAVVALVYGGHLPATGIQDRLVTPLSVPNVIAALTGHGRADGRRPRHRPRRAGAGRGRRRRGRRVAASVAAGRRGRS